MSRPIEVIYRADAWIIARLESFCHWTQRNFGLASPTWERWSYVISIGFVILHLAKYEYSAIILLFGLVIDFYRSFRRKTSQGEAMSMNPDKAGPIRSIRCFVVACVLLMAPADIYLRDLFLQFWWLGKYFHLCDDLPPSASRLKVWLRSFFKGRIGMPVTAPVSSFTYGVKK